MTIHTRPDPRITRAMINAEPDFSWSRDSVPNEMIAYLWRRLEGAKGTALPIEAMSCRGVVLIVHTTEPLDEGHKEQIRGMRRDILQQTSGPVSVMFAEPQQSE